LGINKNLAKKESVNAKIGELYNSIIDA